MTEIPFFMLKDESLVLQGVDTDEANQSEFRPLSTVIRSDLPEERIQYLEEAELVRFQARSYLLHDLAQNGWQGQLSKNGNENAILALKSPDKPLSKNQVRRAMKPRRLELLTKSAQWIRRIEPRIMRYLADGSQIIPSQIKPELEECRTQRQMDIFRYCRFQSSVPYSEYVGRRMRFLVRDAGLPNRPVMGIAALGSSLLQIRCRDEWIGWNKSELRRVKKLRIGHMMDLYVAVAIPPYNYLLGGKLVCYMMVSNEVREAFRQKYKEKLTLGKKRIVEDMVMIVTTSVYGRRSSQYNRIRYNGNLLYIPVGETVGFGTVHISEATFSAFRNMLAAEGVELSHRFGDGANWRMRVIRESMDRLGFDSDECLQHGHSRGVYVVPLARNACEFLRGETNKIDYFDYPLEELVSYWRERWLNMRCRNSDIMRQVKDFRSNSLFLTQSLFK